jgi:hypothetical protein
VQIISEQARQRASRVRRVRRIAARNGLRLVAYRATNRWFNQYGPYALVDVATDGMVAYGMADLTAVERQLVDGGDV